MNSNQSAPKISVVIGVTDEVESLKRNVDALFQACAPNEIAEIVFVTHSRTSQQMMRAIDTYMTQNSDFIVRTYRQRNSGFGFFLCETLDLLKGEFAVYCGADNATDLSLIHTFAQVVRDHPQSVVFASRWLPGGGFEGYGFFRIRLNHLFQKYIAALYHTEISDFSFAYQCVPVDLYKSLNLKRADMSVFFESRLRIIEQGCSVVEVPAVWRKRSEGKTKIRFGRVISYLYVAFKVKWSKDIDSM